MARRQTVRQAVNEVRAEHPEAVIEVLRRNGWSHSSDRDALPESEWDEYRVIGITWYGETLCCIEAS